MNHWSQIGIPETILFLYGNLYVRATPTQWRKEQTDYLGENKTGSLHYKYTKDLNVKGKAIQLLIYYLVMLKMCIPYSLTNPLLVICHISGGPMYLNVYNINAYKSPNGKQPKCPFTEENVGGCF